MIITLKVHKFYDWVKVPEDVEVKESDIRSKKVKEDISGGYLMRVDREKDTETTVTPPEDQIIQMIIQSLVRDKLPLSRSQATAQLLARVSMPENAHTSWIEDIHVHDDGPEKDLFEMTMSEYIASGVIEEGDRERAVEAYMTESSSEDMAKYLEDHFKVPIEKKESRASRDAQAKEEFDAKREAHLASIATASEETKRTQATANDIRRAGKKVTP